MPLEIAALCGCAVVTGYGAVANTAQVEPGATVAAGLRRRRPELRPGARLAGATTIVAVDARQEKLGLARRLGATDTVWPEEGSTPPAAVRALTEGGADYAFEAIGHERTIGEAWAAIAPAARSSSSG